MTDIRSEITDGTEPAWMRPTVERLLASLPDGSCQGLGAIVLTRSDIALGRRRGRRSRANRNGVPLGAYHPRWSGQSAWIELMVDQIVKQVPPGLAWIRLFREFAVGRVLFHEIGHHLDATNRSVGRTGEHGAIAWERRLSRRFIQQTYGYLRPLAPVFALAARFAKRMAASKRAA
jgi:hypothetical protein